MAREALARAPRLVAVDGGADAALALGLAPEQVVGDMDSLSERARAAFEDVLDPVAEQDSTDLQKALRRVEAPFHLCVGFLGARLDHTLAALTALAGHPGPAVLLGDDDCACLLPPKLSLDVTAGTRVSLWPLGPCSGRSTGLHWPIDGLAFRPAGPVGTSNRATGPVTIEMEGPCALILPPEALDPLLAALAIPTPGR